MAATHGDSYWWRTLPEERFWVEIRWHEGTGTELTCPVANKNGDPNAWYDLVEATSPGDIILHWHPHQRQFIGASRVAEPCRRAGGHRFVALTGFTPLPADGNREAMLRVEPELVAIRDALERQHPGASLYLPFQFRRDGIRMMSNYFTKIPVAAVRALLGEAAATAFELPKASAKGDARMPAYRLLQPFQEKADQLYLATVLGGRHERRRDHETLVNAFALWLEDRGRQVARNLAIDLATVRPPVIVEAKIVGGNWPAAFRAAIGQLYEYRYFGLTRPTMPLVVLTDAKPPDLWREYLEDDRGLGLAWKRGTGFELSELAKAHFEL